jgi:plasmid maintenance system antidote protein VapI
MKTSNKVSAREMRRVLGAAAPTIEQLAHNDRVSQSRIVRLEQTHDAEKELNAAFRQMSFMQRVRWFLRGEQ